MSRRSLSLITAAGLAFAGASLSGAPALANGTHLPDLIDVLLTPGDETTIGIEANFGLLESRDGGPFHWICHETISSFPGLIPAYAVNADGVILASARLPGFGNDPDETLYRSDDGCTWTTVSGLTGISIASIAFDPSDPSHAFAAASNGGSGTVNALWVSEDAGLTWAKTSVEGVYYVNAAMFSDADPQVVWASASNLVDDLGWVFWSSNGGASFAAHPWLEQPAGLALGSLSVVATSTTDAQTAWVRTYGVPNRVWLTTNGGAAFSIVLEAGGITDVDVLPDGRTWVATQTSGFLVSLDGRTFSGAGNEPRPRGFAHDGRGLFTAGDPYLDPFALTLSPSGDPRTDAAGVFRLDQLAGPKPCPAGSTVATTCEPLWAALQVRLGLVAGRVPYPVEKFGESGGDPAGGCACSTTGPATPTFAVFAVLGLAAIGLRRRRLR